MDFEFSNEQKLLGESVRRFVARDYTFEARSRILASPSGMSDAAWQAFADLGLLAIALPEDVDGFGGGAVDLLSTMEAIGEALVLEPFLPTVCLGAQLVVRAGNAAQKREILPAVAAGTRKLAFAFTESGSRYDLAHVELQARREGDHYRLDGAKRVVLGGAVAHTFIVCARTAGEAAGRDGISLFVVDHAQHGMARTDYRTLDGTVACDLRFEAALVPAGALLGAPGAALPAIEACIDFATALVCAEAVGAMKFANETTLEYLKTRKQFGVPIGSFQALQHRMVDMVIAQEQSRSMASLACVRVDSENDPVERARAVSAAKIKIADSCRLISQESVQLHGGMGMTEELKVSHTFRRLTMIAQQFGDADHHLERYASAGHQARGR